MLEHTYDFAVGETSLRMDSDKEEILKALELLQKGRANSVAGRI